MFTNGIIQIPFVNTNGAGANMIQESLFVKKEEKTLRDDQRIACRQIWKEVVIGNSNVVVAAPTGWGKTFVAKSLTIELIKKGFRVCFVVDRSVLRAQAKQEFSIGSEYSITIIEGHGKDSKATAADMKADFIILTSQLLTAKRFAGKIKEKFSVDDRPIVFFIDECHTLYSSHQEIYECGYRLIGLSATPMTKGLADIYNGIVHTLSPLELIERGIWKTPHVYVADFFDGKLEKKHGDYVMNASNVKALYGKGKVLENSLDHWQKHAVMQNGYVRKTIVAACNVDNADELYGIYKAHPVASAQGVEIIHYRKTDEENKAALDRYNRSISRIIISVDTIIKGFDDPETSLLMLYRPTKSIMLAYQLFGRVVRRFILNEVPLDAVIVDLTGLVYCSEDIGLPMYHPPVELLPSSLVSTDDQLPVQPESPTTYTCQMCHNVSIFRVCPVCHHDVSLVRLTNGTLIEEKGALVEIKNKPIDESKRKDDESMAEYRNRTTSNNERLLVAAAISKAAWAICNSLGSGDDKEKINNVKNVIYSHYFADSNPVIPNTFGITPPSYDLVRKMIAFYGNLKMRKVNEVVYDARHKRVKQKRT